MESIFPYPGGKTYLAGWVVEYLPQHSCYVEAFAGSASVLLTKPESKVEVINDRDGDIIHFYRTFRDDPDELKAWLERTPFSRQLHKKYADAYYAGLRPKDDIERAGRWFYLRFTQFASKYNGISGFKASQHTDTAGAYKNVVDDLERYAERLWGVVIENGDYAEIVDQYDGDETVFYFDPPYVKEGDALYNGGAFDHGRFVDELAQIDGYWLVSYSHLPDGLGDLAELIVDKEAEQMMSRPREDRRRETRTERLVMNFDPEQTALFTHGLQATLEGPP